MHDLEIVERLKAGDEDTFREILEKYQALVLNCCFKFVRSREEAEDLTQEVFLEVFESIHAFRGEARLSTWIYRIAVTKSLNRVKSLRRKKRFATVISIFDRDERTDAPPSDLPDPAAEMENSDRASILSRAVGRLPENQRVAFMLSKCDELSYEEISRVMGTSIPSVESLIHRAKVNLRKILTRYYTKHL